MERQSAAQGRTLTCYAASKRSGRNAVSRASAGRNARLVVGIDRTETDQSLSVLYVADPHASGLAYLALGLWVLGYPDQAVAARQKAIEHALDANHANTSAIIGIYAGAQLSLLLGKVEDVKSYAENLNARLDSRVPRWAISCGEVLTGWAIGCTEQLEHGIALMKHRIKCSRTRSISCPALPRLA